MKTLMANDAECGFGCWLTLPPDSMKQTDLIQTAQAIDNILFSWDPKPILNQVIAAQVQSLARAISATTDPGPSLTTVIGGSITSLLHRIDPLSLCPTTLSANLKTCGRRSFMFFAVSRGQ
jgi:hypothetical protein